MKLATFCTEANPAARVGLVTSACDALIDVAAAFVAAGRDSSGVRSMQDVIEGGDALLSEIAAHCGAGGGETIPLASLRLLAPLPRPVQMRDCMCFEDHLVGSARAAMQRAGLTELPERSRQMHEIFKKRPIYYKANRFAVVGPEIDIYWPHYSSVMDYELEMGCIIGKGGRDIARADARSHIFGFTIFNDLSARDTQAFEMMSGLGPSKSKDFDSANILGPWIVTADEFYPDDAAMIVRVNGEVRSEGNSASMTYKFEDLIAFISASETLHAGEVLGSGTVGGGCGLEAGKLLEDGDVIELEIKGIGVLRNRVFASNKGEKK